MDISKELIKIANQYENIILSEELQETNKESNNFQEAIDYSSLSEKFKNPTIKNVKSLTKTLGQYFNQQSTKTKSKK